MTLDLESGVIGLVGANGAGKSTLLKILLGLVEPTSGMAEVMGLDVRGQGTAIRQFVGYMPESDCLPPETSATDFVSHMAQMSGLPGSAARERTAEVLRHVGLYEERYRAIGGYSTGMKQRVKLAQALVHDPRLLLLDEPTNGLDPAGRDEMLALIRRTGAEFGIAVIVASHLLGEIERVSDFLVAIDAGRLLRAAPLGTFTERTGYLAVEVEEGQERLAAALDARGLIPGGRRPYGRGADLRRAPVRHRARRPGRAGPAARPPGAASPGARGPLRRCAGRDDRRGPDPRRESRWPDRPDDDAGWGRAMTAPIPATRTGATPASGPGGSIYDLGYQGYHGPRLGRRSASVALFRNTLRSAYGIGRGGRAKLAPLALTGLAILPAILAVGVAALVARSGAGDSLEGASPVRYETYHGLTVTLIMLFCAAQAPELFGRDQRYGVLPLYFSRAITRTDYALAKVAGLIVALLVVDLVPQAILFVGRVLVASDPATGLSNEAVAVPRFLFQGLLTAGLLGGVSALIAAWTPRRAYATAGIIAVSVIPPALVALLTALTGSDTARVLVLFSPGDVLDGANAWIFGAVSQNPTIAALGLPGPLYVSTAVVVSVVAIAFTIRRYRRITI